MVVLVLLVVSQVSLEAHRVLPVVFLVFVVEPQVWFAALLVLLVARQVSLAVPQV